MIGSALLCVGVLVWYAMPRENEAENNRDTSSNAGTAFPFDERNPATLPGQKDQATATLEDVSLNHAMERAVRLRVFYEQAIQQPERGGIYFAKQAGLFCLDLKSKWDYSDTERAKGKFMTYFRRNEQRMQEAREELERRCDGLSGLGSAQTRFVELKSLETGRPPDPLSRGFEVINFGKQVNAERQAAALKAFIDLGGGHQLPSHLLQFQGADGLSMTMWFDNKVDAGVSREAFQLALIAASLNVNGIDEGATRVSAQTLQQLDMCATWAVCEGSAVDRALFDVPENSPVRAEVRQLVGPLTDAIRRKEVSRFLPPGVKAPS